MSAQEKNMTAESDTQHYSQSILVPVANPKTARTLLRIALSMVDPEEGVIKAVNISLGDTEKQAESSEELTEIIEDLNEAHKIEIAFEAMVATSISRGILDEARAQGADAIILGIS